MIGRLGLLVFLARRGLTSSRLTFALLVVAVAAGTGFQIPNTANLDGFAKALLDEGLTRGSGDVRVVSRTEWQLEHAAAEADRLRALVGARAATPVLIHPGAVGVGGRFHGAPIVGFDAAHPLRPFHLTDGAPLAPGDDGGVLLGSSLANRLGARPGDSIDLRVIFGPAGTAIDDENLGRYKMTVRGVVGGSAGAYRFVFVDRAFLSGESGEPDAASSIVIHLSDHFAAERVAERINRERPELHALSWNVDDPYLTNYLRANRIVSAVSYAMVVAAISVPVLALLYIHVLHRRREIGILAALGFSRREIFTIHLMQALVVAALGFVIGSGLGYGFIRWFQSNPIFSWEGLVVLPSVTLASFFGPCLVIVATTLLAGTYPAWKAARTDPARVLRRID